MSIFSRSKKGPGEADGPELFEAGASGAPGDLAALAEGLGGLSKALVQVQQQIADHLAHGQTQAAREREVAAGELSARLDAIARKLDQFGAAPAGAKEAPPPLPRPSTETVPASGPLAEALARIEKRLEQMAAGAASASPTAAPPLADALARMQRQLEGGLREIAERLAPPKKAEAAPATSADWERAILGPGIAQKPALAFQRQQIVRGVLDGDAAACSLAGLLLSFQSAQAERLPQLLKDIGEAYYRWQPKTHAGTNPLEEALVAWLQAVCDQAGIGNRIELVHPGERFDAARHNALSRGVEVAEVQGWIVLRDNGKVYTKANVSAR